MKDPNEKAKKVLAPCGIYCPECSLRVAYETQDRQHLTAMPADFDKFKGVDLNKFNCEGCTPENTHVDCRIKRCVMARKLQHCGQCGEFPCETISHFANDGKPHHKKAVEHLEYIKDHGMEKFLEEKEKQINCACGAKLSWYVTKCLDCGKEKNQ